MLFYHTRHVLDKQARKASNLPDCSSSKSPSSSPSGVQLDYVERIWVLYFVHHDFNITRHMA
jgi:hypothetical protein